LNAKHTAAKYKKLLFCNCKAPRRAEKETAAATARWKANADVALAILWVRRHQNVLLSHAVHQDALTQKYC